MPTNAGSRTSSERGLSTQVLQEYHVLWEHLQGISTWPFAVSFIWRWTANGQYYARSAYNALHLGEGSITAFTGANLIWKFWATSKVKFFLWLTLLGRLWAAERHLGTGCRSTRLASSATRKTKLVTPSFLLLLFEANLVGDLVEGRLPRHHTTSGHVALGLVDAPLPAPSKG